MKASSLIAVIILYASSALGQLTGQRVAKATLEPRDFVTHCGIVLLGDPGNHGTIVGNPSVSAMSNRVATGTADLLQATGANQPWLSTNVNHGNLLLQSEDLSSGTWTKGGGGTGSAPVLTAGQSDPLGGTTAWRVQYDKGAGVTAADYSILSQVDTYAVRVGTRNLSVWMKANTGGPYLVAMEQNQTGYSVKTVTSTWTEFTFGYAQPLAGTIRIWLRGTYGTSDTADVLLWHPRITISTWDTNYVATAATPVYAGLGKQSILFFDGAASQMKTAAFTLNQPTEIYLLCNHWTWTLSDAVFDGDALNSGKFYESATTPNLRGNAGTDMTEFVPPALGTWQLDNVVFDGASSRISTNLGAFIVSDANTGNMGGFTLGSAGTAGTTYWRGEMAKVIVCNKTNLLSDGNYLRWPLLKQASLY